MYVIETDAPCKRCGERHGIATTGCMARVFVDYASAKWVAKHMEGSAVREIDTLPQNHVLDITRGGRHDPRYPVSGRVG